MNASKNPKKAKEAPIIKKQYRRPDIQQFGKLHLLTQGTGANGSDGGNIMTMAPSASDPATKENIVRIDTHPLGIGLYLFDYKQEFREEYGQGRQFGVMADEVEKVMPNAVSLNSKGYKAVNYAMLGISHSVQ